VNKSKPKLLRPKPRSSFKLHCKECCNVCIRVKNGEQQNFKGTYHGKNDEFIGYDNSGDFNNKKSKLKLIKELVKHKLKTNHNDFALEQETECPPIELGFMIGVPIKYSYKVFRVSKTELKNAIVEIKKKKEA
jgi:hypothetical protein